ncbi:MAG TPA: hypothetical protein VJJ98_05375 [Sedimentisphaerales bacterium]|nr:hypothetical protein [Sedimentisphaerales bacterium]
MDIAIKALESAIKGNEEYEILAALNALDFMCQAGHVLIDRIWALIKGTSFEPTPNRIAEYLKSVRYIRGGRFAYSTTPSS